MNGCIYYPHDCKGGGIVSILDLSDLFRLFSSMVKPFVCAKCPIRHRLIVSSHPTEP